MRSKILVFSTLLQIVSVCGQAQNIQAQDHRVSVNSAVRIGKLTNNFTYYICNNGESKNKIEMRLVVKAGSANEKKDQLELAHLLEHVAFEGTTHFPGDSLRNYTAKQGLRSGNEITAHTGISNTRYVLIIPSNDSALFNNCIQILRDWAGDITLAPERIDSQRGVVTNEIRVRTDNYSWKMRAEMNNQLFKNKNDRTNITAHKNNLQHFKHESLVHFYKDWYRPDHEAVIIVGDLNVDMVENKIKSMFSDLKSPSSRPLRANTSNKNENANLSKKNKLIAITHKEMTGIDIYIYQKRKASELEHRARVIDGVLNKMMSMRLKLLTRKYNAPFNLVYSNIERRLTNQIDGLMTFSRLGEPSLVETTLKALATEMQRIKQYGFTSIELLKAKKDLIKTNTSKNISNTSLLVSNFTNHFLQGSPITTEPEQELDMTPQLVNKITLDEINTYAKSWIKFKNNMDIVIMAPEKDKEKLPNKSLIKKLFSEVSKLKLDSFNLPEDVTDSLLYKKEIPILPKMFPYMDTKKGETGITRLQLANGINVILKPSETHNKISFMGFSKGGSSIYNGIDQYTAENAAGVVINSGLGHMDKFELDEFLKGRRVKVTPFIDKNSEIINGSCDSAEIETMFQLVYLYFTAPRKDEAGFTDWKSRKKTELLRQQTDINRIFGNTILSLTEGQIKSDFGQLDSINLDNLYRIYRERFSGGKDFTFYMTGDFDLASTKQLIFKYIRSLPSVKQKEEAIESTPNFEKAGKINKTLFLGSDDKAIVQLFFPGTQKYEYNSRNNLTLEILSKIIHFAIFNTLRSQEGGTYSPNAYVDYRRGTEKNGVYRFGISYSCAPNNVDHMINLTLEEFSNLKQGIVSHNTFQKAVQEVKRTMEIKLNYGLSAEDLMRIYINNENPNNYLDQVATLNSITQGDIEIAAKKYLTEDNFQRFVVLPEKCQMPEEF